MTPDHDPEPPSLAEIVREQTNDGLLILDFLIKACRGELQDFDDTHRLEAAHRLLDFFTGLAILRQSPPDSAVAIVLSNDLGLFREVVRFEMDAIEGRCEKRRRPAEGRSRRAAQKMHEARPLRGRRANATRFSRVLRSETHGGSKISDFLSDVAAGKLPGATPDDVRNARHLLES